MKHKLFFVLAGAAALSSCTNAITDATSDLMADEAATKVDFEYVVKDANTRTVSFVSTSDDKVTNCYWLFGDGMFAYGKDAMHEYESLGTYTVTLTVQSQSGTSSTISKQVTLTEPQAYVDGFTFYAIPYENKCYCLEFKDDNLLPSSWEMGYTY